MTRDIVKSRLIHVSEWVIRSQVPSMEKGSSTKWWLAFFVIYIAPHLNYNNKKGLRYSQASMETLQDNIIYFFFFKL